VQHVRGLGSDLHSRVVEMVISMAVSRPKNVYVSSLNIARTSQGFCVCDVTTGNYADGFRVLLYEDTHDDTDDPIL
jgi:hypothetical protein